MDELEADFSAFPVHGPGQSPHFACEAVGMYPHLSGKLFAVGAFLQAAGLLAPLCGSYFLLLLTRAAFALEATLNR